MVREINPPTTESVLGRLRSGLKGGLALERGGVTFVAVAVVVVVVAGGLSLWYGTHHPLYSHPPLLPSSSEPR
jgi:hypothetical protein